MDGAAANDAHGAIAKINTIIRFIVAPISQKVNRTSQTERTHGTGRRSHRSSRNTGRNWSTRSGCVTPSATRRDLSFYTNSIYYHHLLMMYSVLSLFGRLNFLLDCCIYLYRLSVCLPHSLYTWLPNRCDLYMMKYLADTLCCCSMPRISSRRGRWWLLHKVLRQ